MVVARCWHHLCLAVASHFVVRVTRSCEADKPDTGHEPLAVVPRGLAGGCGVPRVVIGVCMHSLELYIASPSVASVGCHLVDPSS